MMEVIKGKTRIESIDALRGLVMVLMVLDHTRDYFLNFPFYPTNLEHTTPGLFFNRWITNLCAPVFVMLVGTGMFIAMSRGKTKNDTAWFLFTRGIWMIIVEFTLIHFAWTFDFNLSVQDCQVIWAIGWSMIVLAGLIYLPFWCIFIFGITVVTGHNLLDGNESLINSSWAWLHNVKTVTLDWGVPITLHLDYPLIP